MATAGYSGTPLAKKLGIKAGFRIKLIGEPKYYFRLFTDLPEGVIIENDTAVNKNFIHYFTTKSQELTIDICQLKAEIEPDGMIWISWPKKASKIATDVTEDVIRTLALANGLVDIKVCAIDEIWSGLKLVIPVKDRSAAKK